MRQRSTRWGEFTLVVKVFLVIMKRAFNGSLEQRGRGALRLSTI